MKQSYRISCAIFTVFFFSNIIFAQKLGGILQSDTTLSAALSPWEITALLTVPHDITLTIEPGCSLYFYEDAGVTVEAGGKLVAAGNENSRIMMTHRPDSDDRWNGINFNGTLEENILSYADIQHGDGQSHVINVHRAQVVLDHLTWDSRNRIIVEVYHPRAVIQNCVFPSVDEVEVVHGEYLEGDEYLVLFGNTFGRPVGYNDVIDFTDCKRPGPILEVYNNTFLGGGDDGLDLDGADAYIDGNSFMHFHKDHTGSSTSNAIATGFRNDKTSDIRVVRNIFYDNDHAVLLKEDCFMLAENNTFVKSSSGVINFSEWPDRDVDPGKGADFVGNIFWDYGQAFENQFSQSGKPDPAITVNQNIVDNSVFHLGANNIDDDPRFVNPESDFHLLPDSPAIGVGPNGLDMGVYVPAGASISGEPPDKTTETTATLKIAGPGIIAYQYAVNDPNGIWSEERSLENHPTIALEDLLVGESYTVYVKGKTDAGRWQDNPDYTTSKTWTIDDPNSQVNHVETRTPQKHFLADAYPNPFNASTRIEFELPAEQHVDIAIYDSLGRLFQTVTSRKYPAGVFAVLIDGSDWPSGVYFYRMTTDNFYQSKRVILLR